MSQPLRIYLYIFIFYLFGISVCSIVHIFVFNFPLTRDEGLVAALAQGALEESFLFLYSFDGFVHLTCRVCVCSIRICICIYICIHTHMYICICI